MLDDISYTFPFPLTKICYCSCSFHPERFTDSAFSHYGIHQPVTVSKAVVKRKSEFLAGRYCASHALIELLGQNYQIDIKDDRSPRWPPGIVGSITHNTASNRAASVVAKNSDYAGVGLDSETILTMSDALITQHQIVNKNELKCSEYGLFGAGFFVTLAFSAKESVYKALYPSTRQFMDFHDLHIEKISINSLTLRLLKTLNSRWITGTEFEVLYTRHANEITTLSYLTEI